MLDTLVTIRTRKKHGKTRTGCVTCKRRRVKCDENKPTCLRCVAAKRPCEGYAPPKPWLFESQQNQLPPQTTALIQSMSQSTVDLLDRRALVFFMEKTAPQLAAFNSVADELWKHIVPQVSQSEDPLRHMMIAVASRQEEIDSMPIKSSNPYHFSAKHYERAVTLLASAKQPSPVVMLMCCLLFIACENIQKSPLRSIPHLSAGLKILREWKADKMRMGSSSRSLKDIVTDFLEPTFARLEAASTLATSIKSDVFDKPYDLNWTTPKMPPKFSDLIVARERFYDIGQWVYFQSKQSPSFGMPGCPEISKVEELLEDWHKLLLAYRQSHLSSSAGEHKRMDSLEMHYEMFKIEMEVDTTLDESVWDEKTEAFRDILDKCMSLVHVTAKTVSNEEFEFYPGTLPPVYVVATCCRDPSIRRSAIDLLRKMHRHRHDDECSGAIIAEAIMRLEEDGLKNIKTCYDIPESSRIRPLLADVTKPNRIILTYARCPYITPQTLELKFRSSTAPPIAPIKLWPSSETIRLAGYQGLIRTKAAACVCKSYGST